MPMVEPCGRICSEIVHDLRLYRSTRFDKKVCRIDKEISIHKKETGVKWEISMGSKNTAKRKPRFYKKKLKRSCYVLLDNLHVDLALFYHKELLNHKHIASFHIYSEVCIFYVGLAGLMEENVAYSHGNLIGLLLE